MPGGITYEGALAHEHGDRGLFQGLNIWVSQRVPGRLALLDAIRKHGGTVEKLDKKANLLLANTNRNDCPPGAYSYTFIDDSIRRGARQDLEQYSSAQPQASDEPPRATASAPSASTARLGTKPIKAARAAFTRDEDVLLWKWIEAKQREGDARTRGNAIFQELARHYTRHTWQSWRDRWVKTTQHQPRPAAVDTTEPVKLPGPNPPPSTASRAMPSTAIPPSRSSYAQTRTPFTAEDDEILIAHVRERGGTTNATQIFRELEHDFPHHTANSWRGRWERQLAPTIQQNSPVFQATRVSAATPPPRRGSGTRSSRKVVNLVDEASDNEPSELTASKSSKNGGGREVEPEESVEERPESARAARSEPSDALVNQEPTETVDQNHPVPAQEDGVGDDDTGSLSLEEQKAMFMRDYELLAKESEVDAQWWPTISGKTFELWDLWHAVMNQNLPPEERDWQLVAEDLNYNWVEDESVPEQLRLKYEETLADFEACMPAFEQFNPPTQQSQSNDMPSSPPLALLKRAFPEPSQHSLTPKRQRLSRNEEIPSTPDEFNGTSHLRSEQNRIGTPPTWRLSEHGGETEEGRPQTPSVSKPTAETQDLETMTPSQQLQQESDLWSGDHTTPVRRKRRARNPFIHDDEGSGLELESTSRNAAASVSEKPVAAAGPRSARRALPASFAQDQPVDTTTSVPTASAQRIPVPKAPSPKASPPQKSAREKGEEIIEFFMSLGYPRDIVIRSLAATTWSQGLGGQIMELLKNGEPLPTGWRGVWTPRDDELLQIVTSNEPAKNASAERKREKYRARLEHKHTTEKMTQRKAYLDLEEVWE